MSAKGHAKVLRSVSIVSLMTAFSRLLGLLREVAMAHFFGTSALKSAFDIAFVVPNLFRRLFGEGALASAFVPVFNETLTDEGRDRAFVLGSRVISLLVAVLGVVTLAGILLTYPLAALLPEGSRWLVPLPMLRVMLPYALLICVAAMISGMLNVFGKFAISSLAPFLLNIIWIAALFLVCPLLGEAPERQIMALSWAVLAAGVAQAAFQLPALVKEGFRPRLAFAGLLRDARLRRVLALMAPAALGIGVIQINVCLDKLLAFWADEAAPSALEYAERIVYLPLGMFGTAFMTVLLPTFSRLASTASYDEMRETLERAIRNLAVIMAPCATALVALAFPVIQLIYSFKNGKFDATSEILCARALMGYAPGLLVFSLHKTVVPAFYGMQDIKTPLRVSLCGLVLNVTLNVSSVILLPAGWKHVGIAGSTVVTSLITGLALAVILWRRIGTPRLTRVWAAVLRSVACAAVMALAAWWTHGQAAVLAARHMGSGKGAQAFAMGAAVLVGIAVYGGLMALAGRRELKEMTGDLARRRARRKGEAK